MPKTYVPLWKLVKQWSQQSGELEQAVLTNLSAQASHGNFPPDSFQDIETGAWVEPESLAEMVNKMHWSGYNYMRGDAARILSDLVVSKVRVLTFCIEHQVRPPRCVAGFWRWLLWRGARYPGPPPDFSTPSGTAIEAPKQVPQEVLTAALRMVEQEAAQGGPEAQQAEAEVGSGKTARATAAAENKARRYLDEQVGLGNWLPKPEHFQAARAICGDGLSERGFDRVWADIAPEDWRKPGRRAVQ